MVEKIEDLKLKYEKAMDELTQSKINFERDKALKDQKVKRKRATCTSLLEHW